MNFDEADKTEWIPGTVAPVYEGVYERRYYRLNDEIEFCSFSSLGDGQWWRIGCRYASIATAMTERSLYQPHGLNSDYFDWRGLKADPNMSGGRAMTADEYVAEAAIGLKALLVAHNVPGLALDSGEFIPADELNKAQPEEDLF